MKLPALARSGLACAVLLATGVVAPSGVSVAAPIAPRESGGWELVPSPNPSDEGNYLSALASILANDVWAVGASWYRPNSTPGTLTEHWDGSS
jgi:hypothetical protein